MYTTPRKVKQESRLRRTHSLINGTLIMNEPFTNNADSSTELKGTLFPGIGSSYPNDEEGLYAFPAHLKPHLDLEGNRRSSIPSLQDSSGFQGPSTIPWSYILESTPIVSSPSSSSLVYCSNNSKSEQYENNNQPYQTHSSKFPIVKEVTITTTTHSNGNGVIPVISTTNPPVTFSSVSNPPEETNFGGWTNQRKAFTLDSKTGKELQQKLLTNYPSSSLIRRNSLDLEKFIQVFNEEQILMSSMQNRYLSEGGGIDNPGLDLGPNSSQALMYPTGIRNSIGCYYNNNGNNESSSSQSLSLSSSNADSIDTIIYKTPSSSQLSTVDHVGGNHRGDWHSVDSSSSIDILQYNNAPIDNNASFREKGGNQIGLDGHHPQYQQGISYGQSSSQPYSTTIGGHKNFGMEYRSTQSSQIQPNLSAQSVHNNHHHLLSSHPSNSTIMCSRTGNGLLNGVTHNNGHPLHPSQQSNSRNPLLKQEGMTHGPESSSITPSLDKTKDTTKLFPSKTYNQLKGMISRFGNSSNTTKSTLTNSPTIMERNLNNTIGQTYLNGNSGFDQTIGLPSVPYNGHHRNYNSGNPSVNSTLFTQVNTSGIGPTYFVVPQGSSPGDTGHNGTSSSTYKSPPLNDKKNVNTSFRKAIQRSTQKSNLTDETLQMKIMEPQMTSNSNSKINEFPTGIPFTAVTEHHQFVPPQNPDQRVQRALDKLQDSVSMQSASSDTTSASLLVHTNRVGQFNSHLTLRPLSSRLQTNTGQNSVLTSQPVRRIAGINTDKFVGCEIVSLTEDQPPPLPTTQHPTLQNGGPPFSLLPLTQIRENGDGSSNGHLDPNLANKCSNNGDLKSLTSESQTFSGENISSSSDFEGKGGQRIGSGQSHTTSDSGRGTAILTSSPQHSGQMNEIGTDGLVGHQLKFNGDNIADSVSSGNDSEWVDIVEPEIRQLLELEKQMKSGKVPPPKSSRESDEPHMSLKSQTNSKKGSNVTCSEQPLIPLSKPGPSYLLQSTSSPNPNQSSSSPKLPKKFDLSNYNKKTSHDGLPGSSSGQGSSSTPTTQQSKSKSQRQAPSSSSTSLLRSNSGSGGQQRSNPWNSAPNRQRLLAEKGKSATIGRSSQPKTGKLTRNAMSQILYSLQDDNGDLTSTTTGLDLDSMLDGHTENTSEDDDLSTTIDTTDAQAIRRQLESLESMYTEVLKVLGGKKLVPGRYPPPTSADLRNVRRRPYGSMSSLPSSVSSRPFRETKNKRLEDKKKVKDIKSINRRFQRLESHVVTLARSVAHLSSEMRTQHLMVQEMEAVRNELTQLRNQVLKMSMQQHQSPASGHPQLSASGGVIGRNGGRPGVHSTDWTSFRNALPSLTNPCRVRKLTKFFGDEPPLIRIFLKKLGYEKYAIHFEQERIGIMELPYLTEDRLQKMGIPMGPRLRILQEAHMCLKPGSQFTVEHQHHNGNTGNLSVYVV